MRSYLKKLAGLLTMLLMSVALSAQDDTTDLNFYWTEPEMENELDSAMYLGQNFGEMNLEFELTDTTVSKIWVELLMAYEPFGTVSLGIEDYTVEELEAGEWYDEGMLHFKLGIYNLDQTYLVNIRLEDEIGLLIISLTKTLEE